MTFTMMSEGLQEMVWNTASAYIDGFDDADETEREDILDGVVQTLMRVAADLGYNLDAANCQIDGIDDQDELESALCEIEHELDGRY